MRLSACADECCDECFYDYVKSLISDLSKYPLRCFGHECDEILNHQLIEYILLKNQDFKHLTKWRRFHALKQIPPDLRLQCPNADVCGGVMRLDSDYCRIVPSDITPHRSQRSSSGRRRNSGSSSGSMSLLMDDDSAVASASASAATGCRQCGEAFNWISKWKWDCAVCGHYHCSQCLSIHKVEIPELGYDDAVAVCACCFLLLFRRVCPQADCRTAICIRCHQPWHPATPCVISAANGMHACV